MEVEREMVWKLQNCIKLEERLLLRVKYFKIKGACKSLGKKYLKKIMLNKKEYANGQKIFEIKENTLTYFFKNGNLKASGPYINELMEGEWVFYRESGQLWQTGNFQHNLKHGRFVRYDKNDKVEYDETFEKGKIVKELRAKE